MVLDWLKKLSGAPTGKPRDNGTDRNEVIKRVVAGAVEDTKKVEPAAKADSGPTTAIAEPPAVPVPTAVEPAKPTPAVAPVQLPRDKIAQRAFEIWVRKGRPVGTSDQDWLQAEQELQRELQGQPSEPLPNKPR
jgi:hypothetical protein